MLFLICLLIIIFLHELSHLLVAKYCKCGVEIFSIGFGKPLYRKEFKGTIYQISPILLGGYCKLQDELKTTNNPHGFTNLAYRKKVAIALAGISTNIITGMICLLLGIIFKIYFLYYFGILSLSLGITNTLPIPCLDGGYVVFIPIFTKIWGKEKGTQIFEKVNRISFIIIMALNIACIPYLIKLIIRGAL